MIGDRVGIIYTVHIFLYLFKMIITIDLRIQNIKQSMQII